MSRLECKDNIPEGVEVKTVTIRICPDWNVKKVTGGNNKEGTWIRICPDWNVKPRYRCPLTTLRTH